MISPIYGLPLMSILRRYPHPHCSWVDFLVEEEEEEEYFGAGLVGATHHKESLGCFEVVENMHFVVVEDMVGNMHCVVVEGKEVVGTVNSGDNYEH